MRWKSPAGWKRSPARVVDSVRLISITANVGDTESTLTHPASTTHARKPGEPGRCRNYRWVVANCRWIGSRRDMQADLARGLNGMNRACKLA